MGPHLVSPRAVTGSTMSPVAAPKYVPAPVGQQKYYESPPRRADSWRAERPGDIPAGLPEGRGLGHHGPDQGYALKLVGLFEDEVHLAPGEHWDDVAAGCVHVGLKRASLFGRAPVAHDLDVAFRVWGYLDDAPDNELVELRRELFAGVENPHHYLEARRIADAVPGELLRKTPQLVQRQYERNWRVLIEGLEAEPDALLDGD